MFNGFFSAEEADEKKADKDYDKDGKIESPKDEVWGSRLRAAKMAGKLKEEEQLDELSKGTLGSYVKKATTSVSANSFRSGYVKGSDTGHNLAVGKKGQQKDHSADSSSALGTARKRQAGIGNGVANTSIINGNYLTQYNNISDASAAINTGSGAISGNYYLYYDLSLSAIGAVYVP